MKKLNLVVAILVAAALALLLMLFVSTFFPDSEKEKTPDPSPSPSAEVSETPSVNPEVSDEPEISEPQETPGAEATDALGELTGERYTLVAFIGREKLSITVDEENFTRETMEDGEQYYLTADSARGTFVEIVFIIDDLAARKAGFIDAYIPDYTSMDTLGLVLVGNSDIVGEGLTATNGSSTVDAWLIEVESGFFAVTAGYESEAGRQLVYRMLDTMAFEL